MASNDEHSPLPRRSLLTGAAAGITLATLPDWFLNDAHAREQDARTDPRRIGPNDTINVAVIGPGGRKAGFRQGLGVTRAVAGQKGVKVVAVCDVDATHCAEAAQVFGGTEAGVKEYRDFRELIARSDIDAVVIGTPDHWHAPISIMAMKAGKDVYCEKPLTLNIAEGRQMVKVARETGRVFQTGSQQRSDGSKRFQLACELVRNGRIGKVTRIEARLPGARTGGPFMVEPVPADLDWDMWLGPAPETPYIKQRTHGDFRYWYEYSGGMVTDWGAHHLDIAQWALGKDDSGPVKVSSTSTPPREDPTNCSFNVHPQFEITYTYPEGVTLVCMSRGENGVRFEGEDGRWIFVNRDKIEASDPALLTDPLPANAVKLPISTSHVANWVECLRSREKPICDVEVGHRSATVCHLGTISLRLGGKELEWDPRKEEFKGDGRNDANRLRTRSYRGPWKV